MGKAILILDNIDESEIAELRANVQLNLYGEDRGEYTNCTLKSMPERWIYTSPFTDEGGGAYISGRKDGWNDCLDEILGEE